MICVVRLVLLMMTVVVMVMVMELVVIGLMLSSVGCRIERTCTSSVTSSLDSIRSFAKPSEPTPSMNVAECCLCPSHNFVNAIYSQVNFIKRTEMNGTYG